MKISLLVAVLLTVGCAHADTKAGDHGGAGTLSPGNVTGTEAVSEETADAIPQGFEDEWEGWVTEQFDHADKVRRAAVFMFVRDRIAKLPSTERPTDKERQDLERRLLAAVNAWSPGRDFAKAHGWGWPVVGFTLGVLVDSSSQAFIDWQRAALADCWPRVLSDWRAGKPVPIDDRVPDVRNKPPGCPAGARSQWGPCV